MPVEIKGKLCRIIIESTPVSIQVDDDYKPVLFSKGSSTLKKDVVAKLMNVFKKDISFVHEKFEQGDISLESIPIIFLEDDITVQESDGSLQTGTVQLSVGTKNEGNR